MFRKKRIFHKISKDERVERVRKHPFVLPVAIFLCLVVFSAAALVFTGGQTVGADDTKVVQITVDGQRQIVPTRAPSVGELLKRLNISVGEYDVLEPAAETLILDDNFRVNIYRAQPVTIIDEATGTKTQTFSAQPTARLIAQKAGYSLFPEDNVEIVQPDEVLEEGVIGVKVEINRAEIARVNLYGRLVELRTHAETVGELLQEKNIVINDGDSVQPGFETPLTAETVVFVLSPGKHIETKEEIIPAPVETILDSNQTVGAQQTRQAGAPGKKLITYEVDTNTGERKPLQEIVLLQAQKKVVVKGTRPLFADYNADGIPARVFCGSPKQRNWKNIRVQNAAIGRSMAANYGWTGSEFDALLELFACESSWTETAGNPYSGAYGIPQALPASKMGSAGEDWLTNPKTQISWGLGYIKRVYGSPSRALAKHYAVNYY